MKKTLAVFLCLSMLVLPAVSVFAESTADTEASGITNVLLIISQDFSLSESGKTYGMGNYIMTVDENNRVLKFTSFPYNLAVNVGDPADGATKQLMFVCQESGPDGVIAVLEDNFGVTIDNWLIITMTGLADLVDLVGGIEVDLPDLSVNKKSGEIGYMVKGQWTNVEAAGLQTLSGIQAMAYTSDTYYDQPTLTVEEQRFRERQQVLIRGIFSGFRDFQADTESLVTLIFGGLLQNYATNAPLGGAITAARADLAGCLENELLFLHIPQDIFTVKVSSGWESIGYTAEDVEAVQEFIGK